MDWIALIAVPRRQKVHVLSQCLIPSNLTLDLKCRVLLSHWPDEDDGRRVEKLIFNNWLDPGIQGLRPQP